MKKEIQSVKNYFNETMGSMRKTFSSFLGLVRSKKLTVQTEVKGSEKVEEVKRKMESLPKTQTVKMKVEKSGDFSTLGLTGRNLDRTISLSSNVSGLDKVQELGVAIDKLPEKKTISAPPVSQWSKLKDEFVSLRGSVNDLGGGLKNLTGKLMSNGGALMILYQGFKSLIKIGQHFYNSWIDGMKEAAAMSEQNASSIREAAQANEELRQKGDEYLKQLEQFSMQENLSNANKAQAVKTIGELTKAYGDLGIKLDETTGKLTGVDSAMIKKAEKDKARRIKEQEARIRELSAARDEQDKIIGKETFWTRLIGGGTRHTEEAQKKRGEITRELNEARIMLNQLRKNDPAGELRAKKKAETARQEEEYKRRQRAFEDRKHDDAFASETDPAKKIANRQFMLDRHNREVLDPLRKKIAAAEDRVKKTTGDDQMEARRILSQLKSEEVNAKEKSYGWEKQIENVRRKTGNPVPAEGPGFAARPVEKKRPAGSSGQGKNARQGNPARDPDPKPAPKNAGNAGGGAAPARTADGASQNGSVKPANVNNGKQNVVQTEKPSGQKGNAAPGNPPQVPDQNPPSKNAGQPAGDVPAPAAKTASLTDWVRIPYSDSRMPSFDLPGKTNDLIRASVFGAAVVPDKDKYNQQIVAENKAMHAILQRIESTVNELGKF